MKKRAAFLLAAACALAPAVWPWPVMREAPRTEAWVCYELNMATSSLERELPEYPGILFRWTPGGMSAVSGAGEETLFSGMPVWDVFLADLTGDGRRELCAAVSIGSGMVDKRVLVYDYDARALYELSDRGSYDYTLSLEDGGLMVTKRAYGRSEEPGVSMSLSMDLF